MSNMFKGAPAPPPAPTPTAPPPMPDPQAPDALAARKKAMQTAAAGGRSSTQLTTPGPVAAAMGKTGAGAATLAAGGAPIAGALYASNKTGA